MKPVKFLIPLFSILFFYGQSKSQSLNGSALKAGDHVPEALWQIPLNIVNHPTGKKTICLNEYRGKLIILDFWATWCGSCIAAMPKVHNIQEQFKDSLVILPVSYEVGAKAESFLKTNLYVKQLKLFSVAEDSVLIRVFPHKILPHYVWITPSGVFEGATSSESVTLSHVRSVLSGNSTLPQKIDYDKKQLLFLNRPPLNTTLLNYSIFLDGKIDGLPSGSQPRRLNGRAYGYTVYNKPLYTLYQIVIAQILKDDFSYKRINITGTERQDSILKSKSSVFTCDFVNVASHPDSVMSDMLSFISLSAPFSCRVEKRKVKCLVLRRTGNSDRMKTAGKPEEISLFTGGGLLQNGSVALLVKRLNQEDVSGKQIVLDETGYKGKVDISLRTPLNLKNLRIDLKRYGLELREEMREIDFYTLLEKRKGDFLESELK